MSSYLDWGFCDAPHHAGEIYGTTDPAVQYERCNSNADHPNHDELPLEDLFCYPSLREGIATGPTEEARRMTAAEKPQASSVRQKRKRQEKQQRKENKKRKETNAIALRARKPKSSTVTATRAVHGKFGACLLVFLRFFVVPLCSCKQLPRNLKFNLKAKWCELQWFFQLCLCSGAQHNAALHAGKQGQSVSFPQGEQWNWVEFIFNDPEMMQQPAFMTTCRFEDLKVSKEKAKRYSPLKDGERIVQQFSDNHFRIFSADDWSMSASLHQTIEEKHPGYLSWYGTPLAVCECQTHRAQCVLFLEQAPGVPSRLTKSVEHKDPLTVQPGMLPGELEESDTDVPVASSAPATSPISTAPPSPSLVAEEFDFFESDGWPAEDMEIEGN